MKVIRIVKGVIKKYLPPQSRIIIGAVITVSQFLSIYQGHEMAIYVYIMLFIGFLLMASGITRGNERHRRLNAPKA